MPNAVVVGMQWGDEGKGKIVDLLCPAFDGVVRYQGGDNAGHTVKFRDRHFALHLIPSGVLHPGTLCVLGNGMVIPLDSLFRELDGLTESGVDSSGRLFVSSRAHVLLEAHRQVDRAREAALEGGRIGTTARGIGPAYESKAARVGLRMCDLVAPGGEERLRVLLERLAADLAVLGGETVAIEEAVEACAGWIERLRPLVHDTSYLLNRWIDDGRSLLFEGAQGVLLDLDHGTYPYVTSSSSAAGGAATGSGVAPSRIDGVLGILKAYTTRVGAGPFVTELEDEVGKHLQDRGNELGTTTGRPRRCGWFDAVVARYSRMISGVDCIALTKLDVLDTLDEIKICVAYEIDGEERTDLPPTVEELARARPVYRTLPGWQSATVATSSFRGLPAEAQTYVVALEEAVGARVGILSTGPRREETIVRDLPDLERLIPGDLEEIRKRTR